jgi:DNA-binding GntR family transcriptional regulator
MDSIKRPQSLTELVYSALKHDIVNGELQMGDALSEVYIATKLHVSRTPVREAFARLALEGLVKTEPQRGTFVFTMGSNELRKICDVRVCLEPAAMRAAFEHAPRHLIDTLRKIVAEMTKARNKGQDRLYLQLDSQFHQALFDLSGNSFLNDAFQTIASKMAALRNRLGAHPDHMAKSFAEHGRMVELLSLGELEEAIGTLIEHIGRKEGSYWNI